MRNRLHNDAKLFWKYREVVLSLDNSSLRKRIAQMRMNRITRRYNCVIPNQCLSHLMD